MGEEMWVDGHWLMAAIPIVRRRHKARLFFFSSRFREAHRLGG
jgi:hypothetical protein